jgi:predicted branched-subunit amino acid permease
VITTSLSVSLATGLYGISFGALGVAAGLDVLSVMLLSLLMFSGASQFAFIGVIAAGGAPIAAIASAWLLGIRNSFYAIRLATIIPHKGIRRLFAAQLTIDESNAVSAAQEERKAEIIGFWATGAGVYLFWNLATLLGALAGDFMGDPSAWGLDAAAAAAFLGLLWPKLKERLLLAVTAAAVAFLFSPLLPVGGAILAAALVAVFPWGRK